MGNLLNQLYLYQQADIGAYKPRNSMGASNFGRNNISTGSNLGNYRSSHSSIQPFPVDSSTGKFLFKHSSVINLNLRK